MTAWTRWKIAIPLTGLSILMLIPAVFGTWAWWAGNSTTYRVLSVIICLVTVVTLAASLSVGIKPTRDVPWLRIGLVALGILAICGLTIVRRSF